MSGGFGSLYYTDCRPGQGLQGGAGFQFQAASPGVTTEAMPLVQRTALYEPPVRWMRQRRPVCDYPPSLAHTAEGGVFATAAGRYVGQEANGTREGNQFTHAVVTRNPADYGAVRPAQLWGAPWWAVAPAPGVELDTLEAHPPPGPLDVETVRDRVRDSAGGQARLTALVSAIHHLADPEHRRTVVLVSTDPEEAACWVAAATLLLPRPEALQVSFKVFVADAQYGQHDIIALHPEWAGRWADTEPGSGLAVFDLSRGRYTDVEVTDAARFWVARWLTKDPYDVVDAVELAGQFARAYADGTDATDAQVQPTDADRLVAVVVAAGERLTGQSQAQQAADWLLTAPAEAMRIARDSVLAAVLEAAPAASVLRTLAAAAGSRGWAAAAQIRRGLLTAEIGEALAAADGVSALRMLTALAPLPLLDSPDEDQEHGRAELEAALRGARPDQVPLLLTVANRHAVRPVTANFRSSAYVFAAWWVQQSDPGLEPARWPAPPEALDWVRDVLRSCLAGVQRAHAVTAIRARWWRPLWQEACDPADELDTELMSVACQHLDASRRNQLVRDVQKWAFARMVGDKHPSTVAWDITFGPRSPGVAAAATFLASLVESSQRISSEVGSRLCAVLEAEEALSAEGLWTIIQLCEQGQQLPPRFAELRMSHDAVLRVGHELGQAQSFSTDDNCVTAPVDSLFEVRMPIVVDSLLATPPDTALAFLEVCSDEVAIPIYEVLKVRWPRDAGTPTPDECRAVAFSFVLATGKPTTEQQQTACSVLLHHLGQLVAAMPKDVRNAVERSYPGGLGQPWWEWVSELKPRRWTLRRRSSVRFDTQIRKRGE
ncbi:MAG: hypothetical protein ABR615_04840 [Pseudonocardiaceae bacterium]